MKLDQAKDLTKEAPRSPRVRLGDYVIFGRTLDKCRADLAGTLGEYHYNCPLDNILFDFKGVDGAAVQSRVKDGASDAEMLEWLNGNGTQRSPEEVREWSDSIEKFSMYDDPEKRDFFVEECEKLGLDPKKTTLFEWLEADDRASF